MQKTVIILNPAAAGGRAAQHFKRIKDKIDFLFPNVPISISERPGHVRDLARQFAHDGIEQIIGAGGDGTFNQIVNGIFENGIALNPDLVLGTLPIGSGSDFIRSLGISTSLGDALSILQRGKIALIDVGRVSLQAYDGSAKDHLFLNILSCGLSADIALRVNQSSAWGGPFFRYLRNSIAGIVTFQSHTNHLHYNGNGTQYKGPFTLLAVANGRFFGGGMFVAPQAQIDDGKFQIVLIKDMPKLTLLARFPSIYKGEHLNLAETLTCQNEQIEASASQRVNVETDGESIGVLPMRVQCLKKVLKVIVGNF